MRKGSLRVHHLSRKVVFKEGLWRMWVNEERQGPGVETQCLSLWAQPLTPSSCLYRVQQLPRALCLATFPPMMGCPEAPSHPVSFRYVLGPWLVLCSIHSRPGSGRREGGREREVSSSSVCHGLNTISLCWFKPFLSPPFVHPFQKPWRGEKR